MMAAALGIRNGEDAKLNGRGNETARGFDAPAPVHVQHAHDDFEMRLMTKENLRHALWSRGSRMSVGNGIAPRCTWHSIGVVVTSFSLKMRYSMKNIDQER